MMGADEIASPDGALPRIRASLAALKPSERLVAELMLADPEAAIYSSVSEVAAKAGTSTATVVRCAQELGYRGFHDLKLALAQERAAFGETRAEMDASDPMAILRQVTEFGAQTVRDVPKLVDPDLFARAVEVLDGASRILIVGVGTSAPLAQDMAYRLKTIGLAAEAPPDVHVQHVAARLLGAGDVVLAISHTGSTRETLAAVEAGKASGATAIAVTSFLKSPLSEVAHLCLVAGTREMSFRLEAMASRLAHLALIDSLLVVIAERSPERTEEALSHYTGVLSEHRY